MSTIGNRKKKTQTTKQNHKEKRKLHLKVRGSIKHQTVTREMCTSASHASTSIMPLLQKQRCLLQASAAAGSMLRKRVVILCQLRCFQTDRVFHSVTASIFMSHHIHKQVPCSTGRVRHLQLHCHCTC